MRWMYTLRLRLRSLFRRTEVEEELRAEFQYHLERQIEQNLARGMDAEEARFAALRSLGGLEQRKEECRDRRRTAFFDHVAQDLRYAARSLCMRPAFMAAAILSLALGIGANTAVFSLVNALLLTKLPVREPDNLYQLTADRRAYTRNAFAYLEFDNFEAHSAPSSKTSFFLITTNGTCRWTRLGCRCTGRWCQGTSIGSWA